MQELLYNKEYYHVNTIIEQVRQEHKKETQFYRRTMMADVLIGCINDCTILHIDEYIKLRKRIDNLLLLPVYLCNVTTMKNKLMELPQHIHMEKVYTHMCHMLTDYEKNLQLKYPTNEHSSIPNVLFGNY